MKWKTFSELRFIRWAAIVMIILILIPTLWQIVAQQRQEDADAADEGARVLESVANGRYDAAWRIAENYIGNEHATAESLKEAGAAFLAAGRPDEAFLLLEASLRRKADGMTLRLMAQASLDRGRTRDAVLYARRALAEGAGGKAGNLLLGRCLVANGQSAEAVTIYSALQTRYPGDTEIIGGKAEAFQSIDRWAQAQALWESYLHGVGTPGTEAEKAAVLHAKVMHLRCLEGQDLEAEALEGWNSLLDEARSGGGNETLRAALSGRANHLYAAGKHVQAESDLRNLLAITAEGERIEVRLRIALCLHGSGRGTEAYALLANLVATDPGAVAPIFAEERFAPLRAYFLPVS